jgi:acetoin utilization deacetylase AcuC-like enzyme
MCAAVDAVVSGEAKTAFVAGRPPGHHAEREVAMGFCLFGTVAIGVKRALDHHGLARVAVVDFDVHHGNGTQDLLWDEGRCLFVSSHQMPLYPGTGRPEERGAHGQVLNVPLRAGSGGRAMREVYEGVVFPALADWKPELLLISAGFDAHADDPLAGLEWQAEDYRWLTERLCDFAGGRVVSSLEGGYDLDALAASVAAHVGVLEERGR